MTKKSSSAQRLLALLVHIFTASGLLCAFMSILAVHEHRWQAAMLWLYAAFLIDGVDGTLARAFRVKDVLPDWDGKTIDYVIDFATYAIIPAFFFYEADIVSSDYRLPLVFLMLMVSALYYGRSEMVTEDYYFTGFPVLWNMVVFYQFFVLDISEFWHILLILFLSILHFMPVKFAYPSQNKRLKVLSLFFSGLFLVASPAVVLTWPNTPTWLIGLMWLNLLYFGILAVRDTFGWHPK